MSCKLFHGPGAFEDAIQEASRVGVQVVPPIGEGGLRVDAAREAVHILSRPAAGDQQGVLIIGPMDEANQKSCDALLKIIEDHRAGDVIPILWANDLAEVSSTIRSRCHAEWSLGNGRAVTQEVYDLSWYLCDSALDGEVSQVLLYLKEGREDLQSLGRGVAQCIAENARDGNEDFLLIWDALREELQHEIPSAIGFTRAFLQVLSAREAK